MKVCWASDVKSGRQLCTAGLWLLLLSLLSNADISEARLRGWRSDFDSSGTGRHLLEGEPAPTSAGNPGCSSGLVGWVNCGAALDTTSQVCINGYTCRMGQQLCSATCYDPTTSSCVRGSLSATVGADDGTETKNCTLPIPYTGPVACAGDGCPIETGAPLAPQPAPVTSATAAPVTSASTAAEPPVTSAPKFGGNPGCPDGLVGWANCGAAIDTTSSVCINGKTCLLGQQLCTATCYDPATASCLGGSLSATVGADDGTETLNCTTPAVNTGPVACSYDACFTETPPTPPGAGVAAAAANPAAPGTTSTSPTSSTPATKDGGGGTNVAAIIGGAVGGAVGLAVLAGLALFALARRREAKKPLEFQSMKKEVAFQDMPEPQREIPA
ncbi:hypothetical protein KFL_000330030 [Klebsormidium nitens]|uniref:Uncharacterized protein n=1 Tax=Klebsormidium nitens TaxID=105231 RepID=A0A1Y1HSL6_KLENI|nr:hypothetical protein KFL_000330030 [Klebsormidium nitens]|eukprot:GAQ79556.1 hypothetical protein KFL_000330030 [Klebsormidium nitens]